MQGVGKRLVTRPKRQSLIEPIAISSATPNISARSNTPGVAWTGPASDPEKVEHLLT